MKSTIDGKVMYIQLPECVDAQVGEAILHQSKDWLLAPVELYAFDFIETEEFKEASYRSLLLFCQYIKSSDKKVASFNVDDTITNQIKMAGISGTINVVADINRYVALNLNLPSKGKTVDVKIINPFLDATIFTLEKQAKTKCQPKKPMLVSPNEKATDTNIAIAGIIALNTEQFNGTITLAFPESVFLKICEAMFGEKVDKINSEVEDVAGELLNIIYGTAKTKLNAELGFKLAPALPTILSGEKIKIRQKTQQKLIVLPFDTEHGEFLVEITFDPNT